MANSHTTYNRNWMQESSLDGGDDRKQSNMEGCKIRHCLGLGLWDPTTAKVYVKCPVDLIVKKDSK